MLPLWKKDYVLRKYKDPVKEGGYVFQDYEDVLVAADIQTTDKSTATKDNGDISTQKIKMFSGCEISVADERKGTIGDRVFFQGKWFECRSSRLSENTFLRHWTSTFVECDDQEEAPEMEVRR